MSNVAQAHAMMTVAEYLAFADADPGRRYELLGGAPVAMAPATRRHQKIVGNIDRALANRVAGGGCESLRDFGLALGEDADYMPQPDVMVRCGPLDERRRYASDPVVVVEVLSKSTMSDDRGYKLKRYLEDFPTLRHVALVYQDEVRVELWSREREGPWGDEALEGDMPLVLRSRADMLDLTAVGAAVPLAEIYADVTPA